MLGCGEYLKINDPTSTITNENKTSYESGILKIIYYFLIAPLGRVTRHFHNRYFQVNFVIGCSDKLAGVDFRF